MAFVTNQTEPFVSRQSTTFASGQSTKFTEKKTSRTEAGPVVGWGIQSWGNSPWGLGEDTSVTTQLEGFAEDKRTAFVERN